MKPNFSDIKLICANNMQLHGTLKNIDNWSSFTPRKAHMPIFGHTYFGLNLAIYGQIGLSTKETIIISIS